MYFSKFLALSSCSFFPGIISFLLAQIQAVIANTSEQCKNQVKNGPFGSNECKNQTSVSMTFLHKMIYHGCALEVLKIIQLHGLFPQAAVMLPSLLPKLNILYDYKVKRVKNEDDDALAKNYIGALQRQTTFLVLNHVC